LFSLISIESEASILAALGWRWLRVRDNEPSFGDEHEAITTAWHHGLNQNEGEE
jgi:hypothetical protein